jgi:pimeloyl-ACP methyl ester carboxylesterase
MLDQFVEVQGHRVRYREAGSGSVVVLLHGIARSLEDWSENLEVLATRHRVIAVDVLGHGLTEKPRVAYSVAQQRDFLRACFKVWGVERASLVGNSMGGAIAVSFALEYPALVDRLVLVAPAGMGERGADFLGLSTVPVLGELITRPSRAGSRNVCHALFSDASFVTEARVERDYKLARQPGAQWVFLKMLRSMAYRRGVRPGLLEAIRGRLSEIRAPTLVIWGRQDRILFFEYAEAAAAALNARLEVFDPCGHFPMVECSEAFNRLTLEFLHLEHAPVRVS